MALPGWKSFEAYVAHLFGMDTTIASGSKFYDAGDAVTRGRQDPFPLFADAKFTQNLSYSLKTRELQDYISRAADSGKRFILPLRFWPAKQITPDDYVVLSLHDFKELWDMAHD